MRVRYKLILFIMIFIFIYFEAFNLALSNATILIFLYLIHIFKEDLDTSFLNIGDDFKRIRRLDDYTICDKDKILYKGRMLDLVNKLYNIISKYYFLLFVEIMCIYSFLVYSYGLEFISRNKVLHNLFLFFILTLVLFLMIAGAIRFVIKHPFITYLSIPIIAVCITAVWYEFDPYSLLVGICLFWATSIIFYIILFCVVPLYNLKKMYSASIAIGIMISIIVITLDQSLASIINIFIKDVPQNIQELSEFKQMVSLLTICLSSVSIIYTFCGFYINNKISKYRKKAASLMSDILIKDSFNYSDLVKIAYYGGEDYENFVLMNEKMRNTVIEFEDKMSPSI